MTEAFFHIELSSYISCTVFVLQSKMKFLSPLNYGPLFSVQITSWMNKITQPPDYGALSKQPVGKLLVMPIKSERSYQIRTEMELYDIIIYIPKIFIPAIWSKLLFLQKYRRIYKLGLPNLRSNVL